MAQRDLLFDVSRLIWRIWSGRLPTGIDRVCHAYLEHYGSRSLAVLQRRNLRVVLSERHSERLFALLKEGPRPGFRRKLVTLLAAAAIKLVDRNKTRGLLYLNVGHTGLDAPGLSEWLGTSGWKPVFMVHDLIPVSHPQFCRPGEAERHRLRMRAVLESAAGVIVNSAATREAFEDFAAGEHRTPPPVHVAWLATRGETEVVELPASHRPTFVMIGTLEARKNHILLLRIWERLTAEMKESTPRLVLIGQRGWEADDVFALLDGSEPLRDAVLELGTCDDATLQAWLKQSTALLMPSFVEGFGIPLIEAMEAGLPVIASDQPVFREIAGDIPIYLDPHDEQAWEATIRTYCETNQDRNRQLAALGNYRRFSWQDHFAAVDPWLATLQLPR